MIVAAVIVVMIMMVMVMVMLVLVLVLLLLLLSLLGLLLQLMLFHRLRFKMVDIGLDRHIVLRGVGGQLLLHHLDLLPRRLLACCGALCSRHEGR